VREMKSIRFNTEEVRAILDGKKTVTRITIKPQPLWIADPNIPFKTPDANPKGIIKPPYQAGDILYVRETFCEVPYEHDHIPIEGGYVTIPKYAYRADSEVDYTGIWRPSIHMPKEAARIFLKVTGVRVERLQDITDADCWHEGLSEIDELYLEAERYRDGGVRIVEGSPERCAFAGLWNSTIKKQDLDRYGWDANPWVWVIEFERVDVE
jgi:hypothetical protein